MLIFVNILLNLKEWHLAFFMPVWPDPQYTAVGKAMTAQWDGA